MSVKTYTPVRAIVQLLLALVLALLVTEAATAAVTSQAVPKKTGHIDANGVNYYYEIHGQGEPLLLLHGGLGSIDMFRPVLPVLAEGREVIAVDLHGHGRTPLGNRKINLIDIGDDLAVILKQLGYGPVDVLGYSFGAGAGFRLAVQHPDLVRRLALVSGGFAQDGFYPEMLPLQAQVGAGMLEQMKGTPMYQSYIAVAPNPDEFPKLLDNMGAMMRTPYNWAEDVKTLKMPVMLVYGDSDMYRPEHIVEFYHLLGGGLRDAGWQREHMSQNRLAILPGLTHYDIFLSPMLTATVLPFLNGQNATKNWSDQARGAFELMVDGATPEGGCLCGAIRYRVTGQPIARSICHCRSCRLASGAPSVAWAVFRPDDFSFTHGDPLRFESSPNVIRTFCGRCGTPLTYQHTGRPAAIDITTASFDHPEDFPPAKEIWTEHRIPWERVNDAIPQFPRSSLDT